MTHAGCTRGGGRAPAPGALHTDLRQEGLDGVHVFNPDGKLIGRINLPERGANVCFGGTHRNRLFMAASTSCIRST